MYFPHMYSKALLSTKTPPLYFENKGVGGGSLIMGRPAMLGPYMYQRNTLVLICNKTRGGGGVGGNAGPVH